jgi:hypothetical protein
MKLKRNRLISTIGMCMSFGLLPASAMADNVPADRFPQASAAPQQPVVPQQQVVIGSARAPAAQGVGAEERLTAVANSGQLNAPGSPAFGRVASK